LVAATLVALLLIPVASLAPRASAQTTEDIVARDQLIANQENLLNTYRCLFGVDTEVVPGGCSNPTTISPGGAPEFPSQQDIEVRDRLIRIQEALLNIYRCQFDADTEIVVGGCVDGKPAITPEPTPEPTPDPTPDPDFVPTPEPHQTLAVGPRHSCAIRTDNTIACWGNNYTFTYSKETGYGANYTGQLDAPVGQYKSVGVGLFNSCGLRTDGTVACWGGNARQNPDGTFDLIAGEPFPGGTFTSIAVARNHACGIRQDKTVACWGSNSGGGASPPSGEFRSLVTSLSRTCGIRVDHTVSCWGGSSPQGKFKTIAAGRTYYCGIQLDDTLGCWGVSRFLGAVDPPQGQFKFVEVGYGQACAIRMDNAAICWGNNNHGKAAAPAGEFKSLGLGDEFSCGLRTDNTLDCWGTNVTDWNGEYQGQSDPPSGEFKSITIGTHYGCGIRADRAAVCWGREDPPCAVPGNRPGTIRQVACDPPFGRFLSPDDQ